MLKPLRTVTLAIIAVCLGVFVIQNLATTEVAFLTWAVTAPRALTFLVIFSLGLVFGYLVRTFRWEPFQRPRAQEAPAPLAQVRSGAGNTTKD